MRNDLLALEQAPLEPWPQADEGVGQQPAHRHRAGAGDSVGIDMLHLIQDGMNVNAELSTMNGKVDLSKLDLISKAKEYGERKGISYAAWREHGVASEVLRRPDSRSAR
jgi:hypothetical protein